MTNKIVAQFVAFTLTAGLFSGAVRADDDDERAFRFFVASGMATEGFLGDPNQIFSFCESSTVNTFPFNCPGLVTASSNGESFYLTGEGVVRVEGEETVSQIVDGSGFTQTITDFADNDSARGGGSWVHKNAAGEIVGNGRWEAEKLHDFRHFGNSTDFPANWTAGRADIWVNLITDDGAEVDAMLTVFCVIPTNNFANILGPDADGDTFPGPEGFHVTADGTAFDTAQPGGPAGLDDGSATLFVEVNDDDDDDDDD